MPESKHVPHHYSPDTTLPCVHCGEYKEATCHIKEAAVPAPRERPTFIVTIEYTRQEFERGALGPAAKMPSSE